MAVRKRTSLTRRERECRKAAREKAVRLLFTGAWRRVRVGLLAFVFCLGAGTVAWEGWTGDLGRTAAHAMQGFWRMTADSGFAVHTMYLEGRSRTRLSDVKAALAIKKDAPILALSLSEIRARLEELPTVKHASVERQLPDRLYVRLIERQPVAVWQHEGQLSLIDDEGAAMNDLRLQDYQGLPLLIGTGAPQHVQEALALMASHPDLSGHIVGMVRVSDRRWDVHLAGSVEVKLPESNPQSAWDEFARMEQEHKLPSHDVRTVDLRAPDRIYIRLDPGGQEA